MWRLLLDLALGLAVATVAAGVILFLFDRWLGWRHRRNNRHRLE